MKILTPIFIILFLISCTKEDEEYSEFEHCTTIYDEDTYYFRLAEFYSVDSLQNEISLNFHVDEILFPGEASLVIDDELNYQLNIKSTSLSENHENSKIDIQESGKLDFNENEPHNNGGSFGNWVFKYYSLQFNSENGTSSEFIETGYFCDNILLTYAKKINDRDSISINFLSHQ